MDEDVFELMWLAVACAAMIAYGFAVR